MIKLFVTDLDGTFLNAMHISDSKGYDAIKAVLKQQKHFAIATGRHLHQNHQVGLNFLDEPIFKIAMNGAIIKDTTNEVIYKQPIDELFVAQLKKDFPQVSFEWITEKGVYIDNTRINHYKTVLKHKFSMKSFIKQAFMQLYAKDVYFNKHREEPVLAIGARIGDVRLAQQLKEYIQEHRQYVRDFGPNTRNFEIVAANVNKKEATVWLAHYLNIAENEVAVYGNDLNDVPMLEYFTQSFVPENAVERAKSVANTIIESNKSSGVAKHIIQTLNNDKNS